MGLDRLKALEERALLLAETGLNQDVSCIDANEVGKIIDIVKDLKEAMYYCSIVAAMENTDYESNYNRRNYYPHYGTNRVYPEYDRMYFTPKVSTNWTSDYYNMGDSHSVDDGESWKYRRNFIQSKDMKKSDVETMEDLKDFFDAFQDDLLEMYNKSTTSENLILIKW